MPKRPSFEILPTAALPAVWSETRVEGNAPLQTDDAQVSGGSSLKSEQGAVVFAVRGLPPGRKAWIRQERDEFQLLLEVGSDQSEWLGEYPSLEDALQALSDRLMPGLFL